MPFGQGRHWGIKNPLLNGIAGGWGFSVIVDLRDGAPWGVIEQTNTSNTFSASQRPNLLRNPVLPAGRSRADTILQYFDTSAFAAPGTGNFGNAAHYVGYGPGFISVDGSANKKFAITEKTSLQFRLDMYNVGNRPNFSNPNVSRGASTFGRISSVLPGSERTVQMSLRLEF